MREFVWLRATFLELRTHGVTATETTLESRQFAIEHMIYARDLPHFSRHAGNIAGNGFSISPQYIAHDEEDGSKAATVAIRGTLSKVTFEPLHEAISDTLPKERQVPVPVEPF